MPKTHEIPLYQDHEGTIRVSGTTNPASCAARANACLMNEKIQNVDFLVIGATANQQATKAQTMFRIFIEENTKGENTLAFTPFHVHTIGRDQERLTATVFRAVVLDAEQTKRLLQLNPTKPNEHEYPRKPPGDS